MVKMAIFRNIAKGLIRQKCEKMDQFLGQLKILKSRQIILDLYNAIICRKWPYKHPKVYLCKKDDEN